LKTIGAPEERIQLVEAYLKSQGLFRVYDGSQPDPVYSGEVMELNLSDVTPCVSGPKRPHDRVEVAQIKKTSSHASLPQSASRDSIFQQISMVQQQHSILRELTTPLAMVRS